MNAKMDLLNGISDIIARLEALERWADAWNEVLAAAKAAQEEEIAQEAQRSPPAAIEPLADLIPGTMAQGWLASRWQRRDGTLYSPVPSEAGAEINSAIKGGDESEVAQLTRRDL